jgi:dynein heavy chain
VADRLQFHEIMIPTIESVRIQHIVTQLIGCGFPILFPGPTGCGKTLNALNVFSNLSGAFQYVTITFSAKTTANQTQDQIDQKLEKRRKGYYGPPIGKKCIVFVDDFNMPKKEIFGA